MSTIELVPRQADIDRWIRRNEAAREADRLSDRDRSMAELLEETARLSRVVAELRGTIASAPDARSS